MNTIVKILTGILGVLAAVACLATVGIIVYTMTGAGGAVPGQTDIVIAEATMTPDEQATPETEPEMGGEPAETEEVPLALDADHVHDYKESIDEKATCYQAGRLKYTCVCGDYYFVDVLSTGHVEDDWEVVTKATKEEDGLRVKRCIYCDEIVARESIAYVDPDGDKETHYHNYVPSVEREPSCILAGLRRFDCSCGSFYTEKISAMGHVATDWVTAEEATTTMLGREQRTCTVCGVVLDSRPINVIEATPSASAAGNKTAAPTAAPTSSASASASPGKHSHSYTSYVLKEANCAEKGIRSFVCTCGSSYAETIEKDPSKHSFRMIKIPATNTTPGYTLYTCIRCNYSTQDNYVQ